MRVTVRRDALSFSDNTFCETELNSSRILSAARELNRQHRAQPAQLIQTIVGLNGGRRGSARPPSRRGIGAGADLLPAARAAFHIEDFLAQAQRLWCDLHIFVIGDKLDRRFERQHPVRH